MTQEGDNPYETHLGCCDALGSVPAFQTTCASLQQSSCIPLTQVAPRRRIAAGLERTAMRPSQTVTLPGINIQAPWAEALVSGRKVIETRFYPMPQKWLGQPLAIIETPGKARQFQRRIAGLVLFASSWCYADKAAFARDCARHLVDPDDRLFGWREDGKPKWAWPVAWIEAYQQPLPPGFRAGIRYARAVEILRPSAALLDRLAR